MIMVEGWIKFAPGEIEKLRPAAVAMLEATRAEEGCHTYTFSADLADPDILRIAERWENEEAIGKHMATPHMKAFNKAIGGSQILGISLKSYSATFLRTLMGE